jgi:type II secretory pathway component GspD/PulD (secretin)
VWISDTLENIRKIVTDLEDIRTRSERSYLAEVYFIRVNEDDFLQLTADLRFNSVDIFSSAFNVEQLFSMFVSADAQLGSVLIDTRPVLLLSEGRKAEFEVGSEIVRERRAVNDNGVIQTTGYDKFSDGIILSLNLSRVSEERYSVDMELEVSAFDRTDRTSVVPTKSHSVLKSPGLLIRDGGVVYAGSLKRKDASKVFGLFSIDTARMSDMLTIWLRIREIK